MFRLVSWCSVCLGCSELLGTVGQCFSFNLEHCGLYFFKTACVPAFFYWDSHGTSVGRSAVPGGSLSPCSCFVTLFPLFRPRGLPAAPVQPRSQCLHFSFVCVCGSGFLLRSLWLLILCRDFPVCSLTEASFPIVLGTRL